MGSTTFCPGGVATGMKENNARYRPARFGGPGTAPVHLPGKSDGVVGNLNFLPPEEIAPMVLQAVRKNRAFVLDHSDQRKYFTETYVNLVMEAFDNVEAFEKATAKK